MLLIGGTMLVFRQSVSVVQTACATVFVAAFELLRQQFNKEEEHFQRLGPASTLKLNKEE